MGLWDQEPEENDPSQELPVVSPADMLPVQVADRAEIAPGVVSVHIVLPGTQQAPAPYLPGQFVTLALPTQRATLLGRSYRSYALCGTGEIDEPWELAIKRMEEGAVSTYFYNSVREGTLLHSSLPRGTFTLPWPMQPDLVFVFVAVGSGITPILGMLRTIERMPAPERPLAQLHYASKSPRDIIFGDELEEMDPDETWLRQYHYLSSAGKHLTADGILARVGGRMTTRAHWYVCGAEALKRELQARLRAFRVPAAQVHTEVFAALSGPAYRVAAPVGAAAGGSLRVAETGQALDVQPQETLLAALERHGYRPEFSCRVGACGACKLRVLEGQVDPVGEVLSGAERTAGYALGCIARPLGDVTIASGGRPPAGVGRVAAVAGLAGMGLGGAARGGAVSRMRVATLVSAGVLLLGSWNLTDHRPASWDQVAAAAPAAQQTATAANATATLLPGAPTPTATAVRSGGGGGGPAPTATSAGSGGGGGPAPTATPTRVAPTPTPKPTPVCTTTPSKPTCP
jgi:ferredoxin-NADP reductase